MAMGGRMGTSTDPRLLTLTQWLSPAYPLGSFAYSHGVEAAVAEGWVTPATFANWLRDVLTRGSGRTDAVFLRLAHGAEDLAELDTLARAFAPAPERLAEQLAQGAAFARTTRAVWGFDLPEAPLPVAVGRAAGLAGLDPDDAVALYLHAFAANLVSAGQRLMPLGQTDAQRVLHGLQPDILEVTDATRGATEDDVYSTAFLSDIAAMRHETLQPRIFRS